MPKGPHLKQLGPTQSQIGFFLAKWREEAGLSQTDAAFHLGTDGGSVSRWELGKKRMSAEAFFALVAHYEADKKLDELLSDWRRRHRRLRASGE